MKHKELATGAFLLAGIAGSALVVQQVVLDRPERGVIHMAYLANVQDINVVVESTDEIFVAQVLSIVDTDEEAFTTTFEVRVRRRIKGDPADIEQVEQNGIRNSDSIMELADQPLLEGGRTYLLATTVDESGNNRVQVGPLAARLHTNDSAGQARVEDEEAAARSSGSSSR